jgi:hypothetical protein
MKAYMDSMDCVEIKVQSNVCFRRNFIFHNNLILKMEYESTNSKINPQFAKNIYYKIRSLCF